MSQEKKKINIFQLGINCINHQCDSKTFEVSIVVPLNKFAFTCTQCGTVRIMSYEQTEEEIKKRTEELQELLNQLKGREIAVDDNFGTQVIEPISDEEIAEHLHKWIKDEIEKLRLPLTYEFDPNGYDAFKHTLFGIPVRFIRFRDVEAIKEIISNWSPEEREILKHVILEYIAIQLKIMGL